MVLAWLGVVLKCFTSQDVAARRLRDVDHVAGREGRAGVEIHRAVGTYRKFEVAPDAACTSFATIYILYVPSF